MFMPAQMEAVAVEQIRDRERAWQRDGLVRTVLSSGPSLWFRPMLVVLKVERALAQSLARDYHRRSLRTAVAMAYATFEQRYPQWVASLFDHHFVFHHLLPMLLAATGAGTVVTPEQIAEQYAAQISVLPTSRARYCAEAMPAATYFLHLVAAALADGRVTAPTLGLQFASRDLPVLS